MSLIKVNDIQTTGGLSNRGKILQVVQTVKSDTFNTGTFQAWVSITGLSVTITPSSTSNKILLLGDIQGCGGPGPAGSGVLVAFKVLRNGADISGALGNSRAGFTQATVSNIRAVSDFNSSFRTPLNYLDSPSSTSALTYQVQGAAEYNGFSINRTGNDSASQVFSYTAISTIIAMEVAA